MLTHEIDIHSFKSENTLIPNISLDDFPAGNSYGKLSAKFLFDRLRLVEMVGFMSAFLFPVRTIIKIRLNSLQNAQLDKLCRCKSRINSCVVYTRCTPALVYIVILFFSNFLTVGCKKI